MSDRPIRVAISATRWQELGRMYLAFLADQGRVQVATAAITASILEDGLLHQKKTGLDVVILDADLFLVEQGERELLDFLHTRLGEAVAMVLIPPQQETMRGVIRDIHTVREVLTKPVNYSELINRVYQIGVSGRAASSSLPADAAVPMAALPERGGGS